MSEYTIKWTSPKGVAIWLSGESYYTILEGDAGWFMPSTSLMLNYYQKHATISRVRFEPRILTLPLLIQTTTQSEMDAAISTLCNAFNPLWEEEGTLRVTRHDGVVREIKAIYWNGLEGVRSADKYHKLWLRVDLILKCPNHSWYDPTSISDVYTEGTPGVFFPILPITLSPGAYYGSEVVNNPGTMDAWPVWTVTGPGQNPIFKNLETGKLLKLTLTILAGESLIVDTRPGIKTVTIGSQNKFSATSVDSSLWPFIPGNQIVEISIESTTTETQVSWEFNPRYITL